MRHGPYKLIRNVTGSSQSLFDLRLPYGSSGEEGQAVADPQVQALLEGAFERYAAEAASATDGLSSNLKVDQEKVLESLRALGYVQ